MRSELIVAFSLCEYTMFVTLPVKPGNVTDVPDESCGVTAMR
jgi:hypothetical protein